jgi:hypothetical protein
VLAETYHFIIETDNPQTSRLEILLGTPNLPLPNATVSAFGFAVCKSSSGTRRADNTRIWDWTCEFSSEVDESQDQQDPRQDPVEAIPVYETKFERLQEVVTKDKDGDAIANSAGQPFQTGLTIGRYIPVWEFYQFEPATVTDETIIARNEVVNSVEFRGRAIKSLLLTVLSSKISWYYGARRRLTQYSIKYNEKLWTHKRLDVGTVYKSGSVYLPYTDSEGNVILGALDGSGAKQAVGTAPEVLEFDLYEPVDFHSFLRV